MRRALRIVLLLARLALAGVFLWAAWGKIAAPDAFALAVYRYRILPLWAVNAFALWLPWIEVLAALALLVPGRRWRAAGAALAAGMLAAFTAAYAAALARGLSIACGCFTLRADAAAGGWTTLARNAALFALAAAVFADAFFARRPRTPSPENP